MPLIKSVSGIRGTIGGVPGDNLTPVDIVAFVSAYGSWLKGQNSSPTVVIGRDGRISGPHVQSLVVETLRALGIDVIDIGLTTTPTLEMYVTRVEAQGGIVITASHNPREWNALKFLNGQGEFISKAEGEEILQIAAHSAFTFSTVDHWGDYHRADDAIAYHVEQILALELVDAENVRNAGFHMVVDCINSTGALAMPALLDALGCTYTLLNAEITGEFAHNPEPLPQHLATLMEAVRNESATMGIAVDPDVDRLALVADNGTYFGEEYTLVAVADHVLMHTPGNTVSNLSSTQALRDITQKAGANYAASRVGEVHVVEKMKATRAVIGGEGNGGVIYPELHYGRDALVGVALILTLLAERETTLSELRSTYPSYSMSKNKINLDKGVDPEAVLSIVKGHFDGAEIDEQDGLKVILPGEWVHLRRSNTEPIIRVYTESPSAESAEVLAQNVIQIIKESL